MISLTTGDILEQDSEALVNTVNCVGVMGRGVALQFKNAFPENFREYAKACERGEVQPGRMFVFETHQLTNPHYIINFPTKRHWRGNSRIEDIEAGLSELTRVIRERDIRSIAVPPLGSGLGGLNWSKVCPLIEKALSGIDNLDVVIFEPSDVPTTKRTVRTSRPPKMTAGRAALVGLMNRYLNGLLVPFVTLLEIHKLMYFMQIAGEPLKLKFSKAQYGPYAENLRHVLNRVEGHFVSGYRDGGDRPDKQLAIVPGAVEDAEEFLNNSNGTRKHFDDVAELVSGFESPFGLELLSTVHWILEHDHPRSQDELVGQVHGWHERKKQFTPRQIELARNVLIDRGWSQPAEEVIAE